MGQCLLLPIPPAAYPSCCLSLPLPPLTVPIPLSTYCSCSLAFLLRPQPVPVPHSAYSLCSLSFMLPLTVYLSRCLLFPLPITPPAYCSYCLLCSCCLSPLLPIAVPAYYSHSLSLPCLLLPLLIALPPCCESAWALVGAVGYNAASTPSLPPYNLTLDCAAKVDAQCNDVLLKISLPCPGCDAWRFMGHLNIS